MDNLEGGAAPLDLGEGKDVWKGRAYHEVEEEVLVQQHPIEL